MTHLSLQQLNESLKSGKIELDDAGCLMLPEVSFCHDSLKHNIRSFKNILLIFIYTPVVRVKFICTLYSLRWMSK